jgi:peptide/nickel transport system substrate-binding protein
MGGRLRGAWVLAVALAVLSGCGDEGARRFSGSSPTDAGGGGELAFAIAADPGDLDPLHAATPSAQIVARQVFEPLVASLDGPYGAPTDRPGLALRWEASDDFRIWSFHLRGDVRFQDDTPLNAEAVVTNVERWQGDPAGQALLPGLVAADAPRPALVRFILSVPDPRLPETLADPRLGIVSPAALGIDTVAGGSIARAEDAGSGPFALQRQEGATLAMTRNRGWWGSGLGLGPALDSISFEVVGDPQARAGALTAGTTRVAADLPPDVATALSTNPLLAVVGPRTGDAVGFERSVRGIADWRPAPLSGVWVALITEGG